MIHVCFALHDKTGRYSKFTGTTMASLFDNTNSEVIVHILHDNTLSFDNREKFVYLAGRYNQQVKFYNVEQLCADKIAEMVALVPAVKNSWVTIGGFFKFLILTVIPAEIEKIIYLDSDIVVNINISELWHVELDEHPLAAVPEILNGIDPHRTFPIVADGRVRPEDYFNSGVLLMNLNLLRNESEHIMQGIRFRGENPRQLFWDQTVWNYCFSARVLKLPVKFNKFSYHASLINKSAVERNIYHYVPKPQAMSLDVSVALNRLWLRYFLKTPFFDEDTIGRLYSSFQQVHVQLKRSMINISATMSGKTRVFFDATANVNAIKQMFSLRKGEEVITPENGGIQRLIDAMKKSRGKKVFFIMPPNFPYQVLTEAGFEFGKDFVNGLEFLSEEQGLPLNSNAMINAM